MQKKRMQVTGLLEVLPCPASNSFPLKNSNLIKDAFFHESIRGDSSCRASANDGNSSDISNNHEGSIRMPVMLVRWWIII